ncbi:MAG TPA: peptidase G2 autoproteolytic cleavage domain-containing protein [Pyrinomonadaceae bacterium]|nr:peptidase G2 autoproteolytic cleavage domain-containing protein [Pyrinomonadaceae bacterium]
MMIKQRSAPVGLCLSTSLFLVLLVLLIAPQSAQAQWATNGNDINTTNTGNVGVGTTTPGFKLDVVGSVNAAGAFCLAGECKFTWAQIAGTPSQWSNVIGGNISFMNNVGIGTTNPGFRLDVQGGTINSSGGLCIAGDCKTSWAQVGGGGITSVFGRTGAVVAATNDYTWAQINKSTSSLADLTTRSASDLSSGILPNARFPSTLPAVSGANLTTLNASNLASGMVATARLGSGTANATTFLRGDNTWQPISGAVSSVFGRTGAVVAATNDYTWAQINKTTSSLADLTTRSASDLSSGTLPNARFPATLPTLSGVNLTALNASNLTSGTVATARLGSGTADTTTFLRGDNTWQPISGGSQWTSGTNNISYLGGSVAIGTANPDFLLDVLGGTNNPFRVRDSSSREYFSTTTHTGAFGTTPVVSIAGGRLIIDSNGPDGGNETVVRHLVNGLFLAPSDHPDFPGAFKVQQKGGGLILYVDQNTNGNVGIGTSTPGAKLEVAGNISVSGTGNITAAGTIEGGNIKAKYQDVAEWVESSQDLPTGTLVVLDHTKSNQVIASSQAYDTRVAGVISERPGISLGEAGDNKVLVATTGRVRLTVDASQGPIQIGDLLVTSDIPGVAMKSEAISIGGVQIHRPGTLVGKALEPLAKGQGKILVLLSLQ